VEVPLANRTAALVKAPWLF